jgi:antirestriction protein ArdC
MNKVYEIITDQMMKKLEDGVVPWHKSWATDGGMPKNLITNTEYRGINIFLLGCQGYSSPYWVTLKQANEAGGKVRKGESSTMYVYWKRNTYTKENETTGEDETKTGFILRYYRAFNVEQCENLSHKRIKEMQEAQKGREFNPIEECEMVVTNMPKCPAISNGVARAWYHPNSDTINMPAKTAFESDESYYGTLFHELSHSTGHVSRLERHKKDNCTHNFGSQDYSKEELVAEMGSAFLCGHTGIEDKTLDNSASYIASWLKRLKDDKMLVVQAAAKAQKSTDYILGITWE